MEGGRERKPAKMALCQSCAGKIALTYRERLDVHDNCRIGLCGLCGREGPVKSCDLYPPIRRSYARQAGGGERRRAGRR